MHETSFDAWSLRNNVAVADGAWSSQLYARGVPMNQPAELANLSHAHLVALLTQEYVAAGAQFLSTNTFCANAVALRHRKIHADVRELNFAGARIARQHAGTARVMGVMGPSGKILAIRETPEAELRAAFAEQAVALAEGGVDGLLLETFSELAEAMLALEAVHEATALPVVLCMSFDSGPQRTRTMMGVEAETFARAATVAGAEAIGCNCGAGVALALPAAVALRGNTDRPVWVKPSAGLPDLVDGAPVYPQPADTFDEQVPKLLDAGVNVIGGCCGTSPDHIRRIAAITAGWRKGRRGAPGK